LMNILDVLCVWHYLAHYCICAKRSMGEAMIYVKLAVFLLSFTSLRLMSGPFG